jgi:hypothetical protein
VMLNFDKYVARFTVYNLVVEIIFNSRERKSAGMRDMA